MFKYVHSYVNRSPLVSFRKLLGQSITIMKKILSILAQVECSMKSTACVRILKLQANESRFKLFCSCILIMAKLQTKRKLC